MTAARIRMDLVRELMLYRIIKYWHTTVTGKDFQQPSKDTLSKRSLLYLRRTNTQKIATRIMEFYQPELSLKPIPDDEPKTTALVKDFIIKQMDQKLTADMFTAEFWQEMLPYSEQAANFLNSKGTFEDLKPLYRKDL